VSASGVNADLLQFAKRIARKSTHQEDENGIEPDDAVWLLGILIKDARELVKKSQENSPDPQRVTLS
tara:strand:- start:441 stop:641 length:201 start_codon:yes stop_codon:yes gene_type:complete